MFLLPIFGGSASSSGHAFKDVFLYYSKCGNTDIPSLASSTIESTHPREMPWATQARGQQAGLTYCMALLGNNNPNGQYMCRVTQNSSSAQAPGRLSENLLCLSSQVQAINSGERIPAMPLNTQSLWHLSSMSQLPDGDAGH